MGGVGGVGYKYVLQMKNDGNASLCNKSLSWARCYKTFLSVNYRFSY